jgi:hypothetical protein
MVRLSSLRVLAHRSVSHNRSFPMRRITMLVLQLIITARSTITIEEIRDRLKPTLTSIIDSTVLRILNRSTTLLRGETILSIQIDTLIENQAAKTS